MSALSKALENQPQTTVLVQAAEAGDFGAVEALIAAGVDVNSANEHGMTALMAAAANGHLAIVSFLLDRGADLAAQRSDGFDALALAVFYGRLRIVRELLGRGADPKTNDRLGTSPEMWATVRGFHDIAEVLTDAQTITSAEAVAPESEQRTAPSPELLSAQEPVVKEAFFSDQELSDETLSQEATVSPPVITQQPEVLEGEKQPSSVDSTYVSKPRYYLKRKSRKLTTDSSYVESTYVPKPRYHEKRKYRKLVRWLAHITSDWRRLALATLILVSACGLGTFAVLNLFGLSNVSRAEDPTINDLQSNTRPSQILSKRPESDASAERSILTEEKDDARGGPQVDNIKPSSRLRVGEPLPKSSERVDRLHPKEAKTSKQETPLDSRPSQSSRFSKVSSKNRPNAVGDNQEDRSAKAPSNLNRIDSGRGRVSPSLPSIKTQRPRRVAGRNDRLAPAITPGRNTKAKVIQWP